MTQNCRLVSHPIATAGLTLVVLFNCTLGVAAQEPGDALDEAVAECIEAHIATGQYFLIDRATGQLNLKNSSLRLIVSCEKQVTTWVNQCIEETRNPGGCTSMSMSITQSLLQDGWNHRNDLKKWRTR